MVFPCMQMPNCRIVSKSRSVGKGGKNSQRSAVLKLLQTRNPYFYLNSCMGSQGYCLKFVISN